MLIYNMYLEAFTRELEEDENAKIPTVLYLEKEEFQIFKNELHITVQGKKEKIPVDWQKFTIKMCDTTIEFRSPEWEDKTVH